MSDLSWLNPTPHAIAVYASSTLSPAAAQHSLPSGRYPLLGPDFHRLDRTSLRLAHSPVSPDHDCPLISFRSTDAPRPSFQNAAEPSRPADPDRLLVARSCLYDHFKTTVDHPLSVKWHRVRTRL